MTIDELLTVLGAELDALRQQQPGGHTFTGKRRVLSVRALAQKAGLSYNTAMKAMSGKRADLRLSTVVALAKGLGATIYIEVRKP